MSPFTHRTQTPNPWKCSLLTITFSPSSFSLLSIISLLLPALYIVRLAR